MPCDCTSTTCGCATSAATCATRERRLLFVLHGREGELFEATVLQIEPERGRATVILREPPVRAHCAPEGLVEGSVITVRLLSADPASHTFVVAPAG